MPRDLDRPAPGLLDAGLLDKLHLFVHPIVLGNGARWFDQVVSTR